MLSPGEKTKKSRSLQMVSGATRTGRQSYRDVLGAFRSTFPRLSRTDCWSGRTICVLRAQCKFPFHSAAEFFKLRLHLSW